MVTNPTIIRDFIYIDADKLNSLYSQVFEGVTAQILQSTTAESRSQHSQRGPILQGSSIDDHVAEMTSRTENKLLHDHMYNLLESRLQQIIPDLTAKTPQEDMSAFRGPFLAKVSGPAEIDDYDRMVQFVNKFNSIAEAIAYANVLSVEGQKLLADAQSKIETATRKADRQALQAQASRLRDPKHLAEVLGLRQDEKSLSNIALFLEMFYPEGYEITILSDKATNATAFRGVVDRQWLRVHPRSLRSLFGGYADAVWTMVGQVTYVPDIQKDGKGNGSGAEMPTSVPNENRVAFRDPIRNLFRNLRTFERMFFESRSRTEILMQPLAIYREVPIPGI